jgi:hypothetical protein
LGKRREPQARSQHANEQYFTQNLHRFFLSMKLAGERESRTRFSLRNRGATTGLLALYQVYWLENKLQTSGYLCVFTFSVIFIRNREFGNSNTTIFSDK